MQKINVAVLTFLAIVVAFTGYQAYRINATVDAVKGQYAAVQSEIKEELQEIESLTKQLDDKAVDYAKALKDKWQKK